MGGGELFRSHQPSLIDPTPGAAALELIGALLRGVFCGVGALSLAMLSVCEGVAADLMTMAMLE